MLSLQKKASMLARLSTDDDDGEAGEGDISSPDRASRQSAACCERGGPEIATEGEGIA